MNTQIYDEIYEKAFNDELQKIAQNKEISIPKAYGEYIKSVSVPFRGYGKSMQKFIKKVREEEIPKGEAARIGRQEIYWPGYWKGLLGAGVGAGAGVGTGAILSKILKKKLVLPSALVGGLGLGSIISALTAAKGAQRVAKGEYKKK